MSNNPRVAVIGGGAAGFFAALSVKEHHPNAEVVIIEKTYKLLSKVKISGGGRCNVTNGTTSIANLCKAYPRGQNKLKKAFQIFNTKHCMEWFEQRGVGLITQADNCVFPISQSSQTIIDCFVYQSRILGIKIELSKGVKAIHCDSKQPTLSYIKSEDEAEKFDKIIIATGGSPKKSGLSWLEELGHKIENPVPSLFTFNMPQESITKLMGIVVEEAIVSIQGTKLKASGPLLITHWGMSGPAVLKLSAFGARILANRSYECVAQVNWTNETNQEKIKIYLEGIAKSHSKRDLVNYRPFALPDRLWRFLIQKSGLDDRKKWGDLGKKGLHKLISILCNDNYQVKGKTTFKEEFVTCGGVSLDQIDMKTMQSQVVSSLYFAGEVMDIDGITGGYNFQAAWTTGFIAGKLG